MVVLAKPRRELTARQLFSDGRVNDTTGDTVSTPQDIETFEELFRDKLAAVYEMERQLVDELESLSAAATDENLSKGFAIHRKETETQVRRVEAAFEALGAEPERRESPLVDGLLADRAAFDERAATDAVRDDYYLDVATATERIEITSYEGLLRTARTAEVGDDVVAPLEANLGQEEKTLRKLRGLAGHGSVETRLNEILGRQ